MVIRYYIEPDTGLPHIYDHGVREQEVEDVLRKPLEEVRGGRKSIIAIGQTRAGRFLRVIYSPDEDGEGVFVISAYNLPPKQLHSLRRRLRGRQP